MRFQRTKILRRFLILGAILSAPLPWKTLKSFDTMLPSGISIFPHDRSYRANEITKSPEPSEKEAADVAAAGTSKLSKWPESRRSDEQDVERGKKKGKEEIQTWYANEGTRFPLFSSRRSCKPCTESIRRTASHDPVLKFILTEEDPRGSVETKAEIRENRSRDWLAVGDTERKRTGERYLHAA